MKKLMVAVAFLLTIGVSAFSFANTTAVDQTPPVPSPDESSQTDAQIYANGFEVSSEEARQRLSLQDATNMEYPQVEYAAGEAFGGAWLQHQPDYRWVIQLTDLSVAEAVLAAVQDEAVRNIIEFRPVALNHQLFYDTSHSLTQQISALSIPARLEARLQGQTFDIYTTDVASLHQELTNRGIVLPNNVNLHEVENFALMTHSTSTIEIRVSNVEIAEQALAARGIELPPNVVLVSQPNAN